MFEIFFIKSSLLKDDTLNKDVILTGINLKGNNDFELKKALSNICESSKIISCKNFQKDKFIVKCLDTQSHDKILSFKNFSFKDKIVKV